jgi:hypothetical protein
MRSSLVKAPARPSSGRDSGLHDDTKPDTERTDGRPSDTPPATAADTGRPESLRDTPAGTPAGTEGTVAEEEQGAEPDTEHAPGSDL